MILKHLLLNVLNTGNGINVMRTAKGQFISFSLDFASSSLFQWVGKLNIQSIFVIYLQFFHWLLILQCDRLLWKDCNRLILFAIIPQLKRKESWLIYFTFLLQATLELKCLLKGQHCSNHLLFTPLLMAPANKNVSLTGRMAISNGHSENK